jgi:hypothetical protein
VGDASEIGHQHDTAFLTVFGISPTDKTTIGAFYASHKWTPFPKE